MHERTSDELRMSSTRAALMARTADRVARMLLCVGQCGCPRVMRRELVREQTDEDERTPHEHPVKTTMPCSQEKCNNSVSPRGACKPHNSL